MNKDPWLDLKALIEQWSQRFGEDGDNNYHPRQCMAALMMALCFHASLHEQPEALMASVLIKGPKMLEKYLTLLRATGARPG